MIYFHLFQIFSRRQYVIYRISNPLDNGTFARDAEFVFENLSNGDMNINFKSR